MATNNSINNTSNPLSSTTITIDPGSSGDSYIQHNINTTGEFRIGVDDTASDAFKISQGSALGTNDTFIMTASGERTMPLQPSFRAKLSGNKTGVTGDGTAYTIVFDSEVFDQGGDYDGSSTFTAPITGLYYFATTVQYEDINVGGTSTDLTIQFDVNSGTLSTVFRWDPNTIQTGGDCIWNSSIALYLTAADTVEVVTTVSGVAAAVDIMAASSFFCGYLVG